MSKHWSKEEQTPLLSVIPSYRLKIQQLEIKQAKHITLQMAHFIHREYPIVQERTVNAIYERLPYLENLLAGVFKDYHYAEKDRHLYSTLPREHNSQEPLLCNTRHKYNGAMTEYLNNKIL